MFDTKNIELSLISYWESFGLTEQDFHCRECGKLMLDFDDLHGVGYNAEQIGKQKMLYRDIQTTYYAESEHNRWLVRGRTLSGKTYFRHLCWDCFFKHLGEVEDIPRRARKSSWYKDVNNGILRPPATCSSPSKYFKLLFDITDEELETEHKKFDTASLDSFIRRHGEKEGRIKYEEYKKRQAYTCSKEYMMNEKGMSEREWNQFNASRACTKKNFIKRYGKELGESKWEKYCETEAYAGNKLEYFVSVYGKDDGLKRYLEVCRKKCLCPENFKRKYGDELGMEKWKEYLESHKQGYLQISQDLFKSIDMKYEIAMLNSRFASKNSEVCIELPFGNSSKCFFLDYVLFNKVIEFNGDYFHANPTIYSESSHISRCGNGDTAGEIWKHDRDRTAAVTNAGYKVKIVWESDYNRDPEKVLTECVEFLKS